MGRSANYSGVTIVAVNDTSKTIEDMQLSGVYNGLTLTDTFAGPFTAGQTYTLHKDTHAVSVLGPDAMCVLNHVTYADGSDWTMSAKPVSERRASRVGQSESRTAKPKWAMLSLRPEIVRAMTRR